VRALVLIWQRKKANCSGKRTSDKANPLNRSVQSRRVFFHDAQLQKMAPAF
jgi:hypothetical protein